MNQLIFRLFLLFATVPVLGLSGEPPVASEMGGAYCQFAGKFGGEVPLKYLQTTEKLEIAGCAAGSTITKFKLIIKSADKTIKIDGKSATLTEEMLKALKALSPGDTFVFDNMKAKLPSGGTVDVWCKTFTVVT